MADALLPLFPLNIVLFPRTDLPLHIFEERYKEMIGECLQKSSEFGVVLVQERSLENTGCSASITQVVKRYDDGRMDILVRGQRRFEIVMLNQERSYLRGEPAFFEDESPLPPSDERRRKAVELYDQAKALLGVQEEPETAPKGADAQLSFQIMARLPADLGFKQSLLPLRSEEERISRVVSYLEQLLSELTRVSAARTRAGRNGHGR